MVGSGTIAGGWLWSLGFSTWAAAGGTSAALAALAGGTLASEAGDRLSRCPHRFFLFRHSAHACFLNFTSASEALKKMDISMG
jgi:hypothetical protein